MAGVLVGEIFKKEVFHKAGMFADSRDAVGLWWGETDWQFARFCSTVFHAACVDGDDVTGYGGGGQEWHELHDEPDPGIVCC